MEKRILVNSVQSYLDEVFKLPADNIEVRCYRGQSDISWDIKPSVLRNLKPQAEGQMFSELTLEAPGDVINDKTMFEKLVRAQHYGLPTRILDVSLNPLVALYFACNELDYHSQDGVVNIFDFKRGRVKFADSDAISLVCNLARLSDEERENLIRVYRKEKKWNDSNKAEFREIPEMKRLTQFVRVEKPYFLDSVEPADLFRYFFVHPAKSNRRVIAQSGAFIAAGLLRYSSPKTSSSFDTREIVIPKDGKREVLGQLDVLNINSRTMFPEIEFASKYIKQKWTKSNN